MERYFHFTCKVCGQEFIVPYYDDPVDAPEEMFTVMEHEDAHIEEGEHPDWDCEIEEVTMFEDLQTAMEWAKKEYPGCSFSVKAQTDGPTIVSIKGKNVPRSTVVYVKKAKSGREETL